MPPGARSAVVAAAEAALHADNELEKASQYNLGNLLLRPDMPRQIAIITCADALAVSQSFEKYKILYVEELSPSTPIPSKDFHRSAAGQAGVVYYLPEFGHQRRPKDPSDHTFTIWGLKIKDATSMRWYVTEDKAMRSLSCVRSDGTIDENWDWRVEGDELYDKLVGQLTALLSYPYDKPPAQAYTTAMSMTDWSCQIEDERTAWDRVMNTPYTYHNAKEPFRDMTGDRYLLDLEPAKRLLASIVHMTAAQYLLFKRKYFKTFFRDLSHNRDKIPVPTRSIGHIRAAESAAQARRNEMIAARKYDVEEPSQRTETPQRTAMSSPASNLDNAPAFSTRSHVPSEQRMSGAEAARQMLLAEEEASTIKSERSTPQRGVQASQVRSDKNHIDAIRAQLGFSWTNARLIQEGWKAMGILKEEKYVDWIDAGGQFETIGTWEE